MKRRDFIVGVGAGAVVVSAPGILRAQAATVKIGEEKKHLLDEQVFLQNYVKMAEANVKYYYDLNDKITAAEAARIEAEKAAAAAAKKS